MANGAKLSEGIFYLAIRFLAIFKKKNKKSVEEHFNEARFFFIT